MSYSTLQGDTADPISFATDANYTGYSGFVFKWRRRGSTGGYTTGTGTLVLLTSGASGSTFRYTFAVGETATPGEYEGKISGTLAGAVRTTPTTGGYLFTIEPL